MAEYLTTLEFERWSGLLMGQIKDGFDGVNSRLDALNDRTRKNSEGLIELESEVKVINTRGCAGAFCKANPEVKGFWKSSRGTATATAGGAGVVVGLLELAKLIISRL